MRTPSRAALAVACLVALAGCSLPSGGSPSPTATPTPATPEPEPYPPGLSEDGVENGTTLFRAHVDATTATGYTAVAAVNTTVHRNGFLIEVQTRAELTVEPNASGYLDQRRVVGGPVERREAYWSNGSVEIVRRQAGGETEYERGDPRSPRQIAGRRLLLPYLTGGEFEVESANESNGTRRITLLATSMSDPEAVRPALPEAAESIESFRARLVVDGERIRSLEADVEFGIEETNRTHHVEYELLETGDVAVDQPDWVVDASRGTETTVTATDTSRAASDVVVERPTDRRRGSATPATTGGSADEVIGGLALDPTGVASPGADRLSAAANRRPPPAEPPAPRERSARGRVGPTPGRG